MASTACVICESELKPWRWSGLQSCAGCGYVRKVAKNNGHSFESVQQDYFNDNFAAEDDRFVRFYEKQNARRRLSQILRFKQTGRVLEVGVGRGTLLSTLKGHGFAVEGLDLSEAVRSFVSRQTGITVQGVTLPALAATRSAESYDVVVMSHVLEHIEQLQESLASAARLLKDDGVLYLAVPNVACWNSYLPGWTGYEPYHLHYFQLHSLRRLLEKNGFQIIQASTFEPLSGWFNAVVRSLRHSSPDLESSSSTQLKAPGLARLVYNVGRITFGGLTSPVRWMQSALGRGEELVVVAKVRK